MGISSVHDKHPYRVPTAETGEAPGIQPPKIGDWVRADQVKRAIGFAGILMPSKTPTLRVVPTQGVFARELQKGHIEVRIESGLRNL